MTPWGVGLDPLPPTPDWEAALQEQGWSSRATHLLTPLLLTLLGKLVNNYVAKAKAALKISREPSSPGLPLIS